MTRLILAVLGCAALAACSSSAAAPLEPIPGSLTYGGQPRTKLTKSPIGSVMYHRFPYRWGTAQETYILQPDRSLKLVRREIIEDFPDFD